MCHEFGHMFGIKHCVFYNCLLNGSNHIIETDNRPGRIIVYIYIYIY